jgi:cyclic pyranopterin phosphate synthase
MPAEGLPWLERGEILRFEEITRLVGLLARMGVADVRLTGGEPLVRRDFPRLVGMLKGIEELGEVSLTTNGFLLERDAEVLVRAGIDRFNVSVDSLQGDRFYELTRRDALPQVLRGLERLATFPEAHPIKINAVAIRGFTEEETLPFARLARRSGYQVRFIEYMPLDADHAWTPGVQLCRRAGTDRLHQPGLRALLRGLQPDPPDRRRAPAHLPVLAERDRSSWPHARGRL